LNDLEFHNLNLLESLRENAARPGTSLFRQASVTFTCSNAEIKLRDLLLLGSSAEVEGFGSLDFSRNLDLRLRVLRTEAAERSIIASDYRLTGPLSSPEISRIPLPAPPRP